MKKGITSRAKDVNVKKENSMKKQFLVITLIAALGAISILDAANAVRQYASEWEASKQELGADLNERNVNTISEVEGFSAEEVATLPKKLEKSYNSDAKELKDILANIRSKNLTPEEIRRVIAAVGVARNAINAAIGSIQHIQ